MQPWPRPPLPLCGAKLTASRGAPLSLQFPLQLVEEAPVGALGNELLRTRLEHPGLMEAQGIEAHRVLRVILAPFVIGQLPDGLERIVIPRRIALLYEELRTPLG